MQEHKADSVASLYRSFKHVMNTLNDQQGETTIHSAFQESQLIPADLKLPDLEMCRNCKVSKGNCTTFDELVLLQETCERRKFDGNQCIVPVSIKEPKEESGALRRELSRVLPTARLRGRSFRYVLVRCDSIAEPSSRAVYTQVRYDSIPSSSTPSPSPSRSRSSPSPAFRSIARSRSNSPSRNFGRLTSEISGFQGTKSGSTSADEPPKLK